MRFSLTGPRAVALEPLDSGGKDSCRHDARPGPPRAVAFVVDVAVRAVQFTSRRDLEYELQRRYMRGHARSSVCNALVGYSSNVDLHVRVAALSNQPER